MKNESIDEIAKRLLSESLEHITSGHIFPTKNIRHGAMFFSLSHNRMFVYNIENAWESI